ncbi:MAG: O-antigen ligase family protein [Sulfuriferula multivorans]|uniref:O-antigen ligase family protein n=1 Tax=Sulfuriferula multivorans TaxID=1559896 RepID=A0A7C9KA71_9PROT|nr:O-antigen ligase family protein [Sulfuriferula multivorans]
MTTLYILITAMPFLVMFAMGLLLPLFAFLLYTRFSVGLVTIAMTFFVDAMAMGYGGFHLGINLFYADIGLLPIAGIALLRLLFAGDFPLRHRAWLVFSFLVLLGLALGLVKYGSTAGVQVRPYFYFVATGLYGMSFPMDRQRLRFAFNVLSVVAVLLLALTAYRWIVYYSPITSLLPPGGSYNVDGPIRVIKSHEALVLAEVLVFILLFTVTGWGARLAQAFSPVLLLMVIALQHRSVWLAAMVGILARFLVVRGRQASTTRQLIVLSAISVLTITPMLFSSQLSEVTQQVQSSAQRVLQGADTTGERLSNWKSMVQLWYQGGGRSIGIGMGFGGDSSRYIDSAGSIGVHKISYFAHNMYVQTLYNTGLLGLAALLMAIAFVIRGLYRLNQSGDGGVEVQILLVLMAMQIAFYVPYGTDYLQSLLFGVALAYVASSAKRSKETTTSFRCDKEAA